MPDYSLHSHAEILSSPSASHYGLDLADALDELSQAAFGQYDGVIAGTPEFKRWFMSRPGMTDDSRFVATCDGEVVSSVFVTLTPMQWGGEVMTAGLIDSVMTHPAHRRQGLAKALLVRAADFMRERDVDLSLLYTVSGSMPYEFYASMGYVDYLRVQLMEAKEREVGEPCPLTSIDSSRLRELLDRVFAGHDGYLPMSEQLWQWRRERRPSFVPVQVYTLGDSDAAHAIFAIGQAPIRLSGGRASKCMLNDCAAPGGELAPDLCQQMLSAAPAGVPVMAACAETNESDQAALMGAGFAPVSEEACMIKPLSERAQSAIHQKPRQWYTVTETIVGI